MAFAHGPEDFLEGQKRDLKPFTYLNSNGVFSFSDTNVKLHFLNGVKYTQCQDLVCNFLKEENLFVNYSKHQAEQNVCWRHKCGVYYNATWQVFLKLNAEHLNLKNKVKKLLSTSEVENKDRLFAMLEGRSHWCLSRQRHWGCPMNLLVLKNEKTLSPLSSLYLSYLQDGEYEKAKHFLDSHPELELFTDVLDVWFDSGNVANAHLDVNDFKPNEYVADLVLEGKDQYRGWFQSLLWLTVAVHDVLPYKNVFCHGFVLDEQKEKLSKSAGNANLVEHYAHEYGNDVLHLWVASQLPENDPVFSKLKLNEVQNFYSRFRLTLRFLTSNLYDYDYKNHQFNLNKYYEDKSFDLHRYLLKEVYSLYNQLCEFYRTYQFKKALDAVYLFFDRTLSGFYFESLKNSLYLDNLDSERRAMNLTGLFEVLLACFDLAKVFCPFVSEEFYQDYFNNGKSVFEDNYFNETKVEFLKNLKLGFNWLEFLEMKKSVNLKLEEMQKEKLVKSRTETQVQLYLPVDKLNHFKRLDYYLKARDLFQLSSVKVFENETFRVDLYVLKNDENYQKCSRCWNYELKENFQKVENSSYCEHCLSN
jgi:isoleucyl-tRNA synthetase